MADDDDLYSLLNSERHDLTYPFALALASLGHFDDIQHLRNVTWFMLSNGRHAFAIQFCAHLNDAEHSDDMKRAMVTIVHNMLKMKDVEVERVGNHLWTTHEGRRSIVGLPFVKPESALPDDVIEKEVSAFSAELERWTNDGKEPPEDPMKRWMG